MAKKNELVARIQALPREHKTVYALRYEHALSDAQIAEVLGISEDDVVRLMLAALNQLRGQS
jgi:DNA-directed RNA polymerase specialized sigma subunit